MSEKKEEEMNEKFKEYPSIENSYLEKFIDIIKMLVPDNEEWCVLEKIHGANIQIYYDEDGLKYGKRTSFIKEDFYNARNILPKYEDKIKNLFNEYKKPIRIFGEIFGGKYNGKYANTKCVQKEVEYSQEIEVLFFDLMIDDKIIPYRKAINILGKYEIPYIVPLAICSLDEALEYSNDFPSKICRYYNLEIQEKNICEGVVIKPFENEYFTKLGSRIILKNKNEKFKEKKKVKKINKLSPLSDNANALLNNLESFITENRFNSVYSKYEFTKKDFGVFLGFYIKDVVEDAQKNNINFKSVNVEERKRVNKILNKKFVQFTKKIFFKRVDF